MGLSLGANVADLRIKAAEDALLINALVAAAMIRRAVDAPPAKDGGPDEVETVLQAQVFIWPYLVGEADFDRPGLEQFIEDVTAYRARGRRTAYVRRVHVRTLA